MSTNYTLKAFSFTHADDVDKLFAFEDVNQNAVANFDNSLTITVGLESHFAHKLHWRKIVLRQMSTSRLGVGSNTMPLAKMPAVMSAPM